MESEDEWSDEQSVDEESVDEIEYEEPIPDDIASLHLQGLVIYNDGRYYVTNEDDGKLIEAYGGDVIYRPLFNPYRESIVMSTSL